MKKICTSKMTEITGGKLSPHTVIFGCTLTAAAAGLAAAASGGLLAYIGILALTQAGCMAIEMPW